MCTIRPGTWLPITVSGINKIDLLPVVTNLAASFWRTYLDAGMELRGPMSVSVG